MLRYNAQASQRVSDSAIPNVSLARRLHEIMLERKLSIRAFCEKNKELFGFSHELLRNIICGNRPLLKQEEKLIVQALNLTMERFRGEDTRFDRELLDQMVSKGTNFRIAVETALKILPVALGASERFDILYSLGRAYLGMKEYEQAHEVWMQAYQHAIFLYDRFQDKERHFLAIKALAVSAHWVHDLAQLGQMLLEAESLYSNDLDKKSQIVHLRALNSFRLGDVVGAQRFYNRALKMYRDLGDTYQIGKVLYDMGLIAIRHKKYKEATELLQEACSYFASLGLIFDRLIATKNLLVALFHRGCIVAAIELAESALSDLDGTEMYELKGKFLLMLTHMTGDVGHAEQALRLPIDDSLIFEIASYLEGMYLRAGEYEKAYQYSKVVDETPHILFMDKEGF